MTLGRGPAAAAAIIALAGPLALGTLHAAQQPTSIPDSPPPFLETQQASGGELHLAILRDATADRPARESAADTLIRLAHRPAVADALTKFLLDDDLAEPRSLLLRALSRTWNPPARLFRPLVDLADRTEAARLTSVLNALAAYASRDAAAALITFLHRDRPAQAREAAAAALTRMTGRDDLRADPEAWGQWLSASRRLTDDEWKAQLAEGIWRRADRLESDRRALGERVAEGFRRLYISTPVEERSRLLSQMMLDTRAELRDVGLEIVSREIAAGKGMDSAVTDAAVRLLRSADPRVRTRAAVLIAQLGTTAASTTVLEALAAETDAEAAAALLLSVARAPDAAAIPFVLIWLAIPESRPQAIDGALALHRAGLLFEPSDKEHVLAALREIDPTGLSSGGVRLLAALGHPADRQRLAILLEIGSSGLRLAAADALADFPEFVEMLIDATRRDPALFSAAVRSTSTWRPTVSGLMAITHLPAPSPQEHRAGVLRIASALPMVDLLAVAASTNSDLTLREALLVRAADRPMGPFLPDQEEDLATVGECILLLAETRLAMRRPDLALAALDALPPAWPELNSPRSTRARLIALLWTNRIPATAAIEAPAAAWLDALELAIEEAHAPAILREIRRRFGSNLSPEDARRRDTLASALPEAATPDPAGTSATSLPPGGQ